MMTPERQRKWKNSFERLDIKVSDAWTITELDSRLDDDELDMVLGLIKSIADNNGMYPQSL